MPSVPARCDVCGLLWAPPWAIQVGDGAFIGISNTTVSPCPRCGGTGHFVEGFFKAAKGAFEVIYATEGSIEILRGLGLELVESYERGESAEAVAEKAAEIDPQLGEMLLAVRGDRKLFLQLLIMIIALITAVVNAVGEGEKFDFHFDHWFSTTINNYDEQSGPQTVDHARETLKHSARPHDVDKHEPGHQSRRAEKGPKEGHPD